MAKTDFQEVYAVMYFSPRTDAPMSLDTLFIERQRAEEMASRYALDKQLTMYVVKLDTIAKVTPTVKVERTIQR